MMDTSEGNNRSKLVEDAQNGNAINQKSDKAVTAVENNSPCSQQELKLAFEALDGDKDGVLSKEEMKAGLKRLWSNIGDRMLDVMFEQADINHDGVISFTEFCRVMSL